MDKKSIKTRCAECGEIHEGSPSFGYKYPTFYFDVPEIERDERTKYNQDLCVIYPSETGVNKHTIYCIRTELLIRIIDVEAPFSLGVWVSQSEESFDKYVESLDGDQSNFKSFGWLALSFPYYKTLDENGHLVSLACDVIGQSEGQRPTLHIQESDHSLFKDQHEGITWEKAMKLSHEFQN